MELTFSEKYKWIAARGNKIKSGQSTLEERNEFMDFMYAHGEIDKEEYDHYRAGRHTERILNMALVMGIISLLNHFLETVFVKPHAESLISQV